MDQIAKTESKEVRAARQATARRLESISLERRERYQVIERKRLNSHRVYPEPWFLSTYAHTLPFSRTRYLSVSNAVRLGETLESPTTAARDYLKLVYVRAPGLRGLAADVIPKLMHKRSPAYPLFAEPCRFEHGFYLDIYHCFWSIMLVAGWNVAYLPEKYLLGGRPPYDFPFPEHGVARNCLVSCAMKNEIIQFVPPKPTTRSIGKYNPMLNETLAVLIRDVLHAIAWQARECGAVYWHTDGCVCPDAKSAKRVDQMIEDWGLNVHCDAIGPGRVIGVGSYRVGDKVTLNAARGQELAYDGLLGLGYSPWLQTRFAALASRNA